MDFFHYKNGKLFCEDKGIAEIAELIGTPFYIYSHATLTHHYRVFSDAFKDKAKIICYAAKANSNIAILRVLASLGAGADIVSGGELFRSLEAGIPASKIVYSGVGKTPTEIEYALQADILMFNVESLQELDAINTIAGSMGKVARVAMRVNPDVDPQTHPKISTGLKENKFGVDIKEAPAYYQRAQQLDNVEIVGISCHIGSQLTKIAPFVDALKRIKALMEKLEGWGIDIKYLDLGGGLGITYKDEEPPSPASYAREILSVIDSSKTTLIFEPGRVLVGNAGVLVTRVLYTKENHGKKFVVVDAGMNDLIRPSFYESYHKIQPVYVGTGKTVVADVVGPICETGDYLARQREIADVQQGDLLAVMSSGAYGFTMSSNYNSRGRAAEVLVAGKKAHLIRKREKYQDLIKLERIPKQIV
ncbi:MAG: diaminopimelate decarboxylase [Deltaproteobacteria bacterium]|nr:diaminopimelate decarboxylase [Deltaproteobacteria bacterium]